MSFNWINAEDYTMDTILLLDRWVIRYIMSENPWYNGDYAYDMGKALSRYPNVISFCKRKAPECTDYLDRIKAVSK